MRILPVIVALTVCFTTGVSAQPKSDPNLKKPKEFEERKLGSEKMAGKKFTLPRHVFQNMFTHYNYYFNANNLLNEIIDAAKLQHKEDYTSLLPFYNYSLDATSKSGDIDTILEKCTAGILLHDLRNDWIDNMYLLMGRAYMLRKNFDSAAMTFQFINYTYSPKDKDGDDQLIGSNRVEGATAFTIATKEKRNIAQKVFTKPPSRNESFVWQIRNYIETEQYIDAASLITTLRNDPNFPARLKEELAEVEAYNYYKQQAYDSSAHYLTKAVSLADNRTEKARWYYLIGQMYQLSGDKKQAAEYFTRCVNTTTDIVMEVYARLSSLRLRKADDPNVVQENINELLKMARREKYEFYRDIIYYAAAIMETERGGYAMAETYLKKSIAYNTDNVDQRSKSFLLLSDMLYDTKAYGRSGFYYDSVNTSSLDSAIAGRVNFRKPPTKSIYDADRIIFAQDSLQKIAAMPETERNNYLRTLAKRLRKEKGLKDEVDSSSTGQSVNAFQIGKGPANLFDNSSKEFYFYNPQVRANGFNEFKQRWGARPNVDNWRRSTVLQSGNAIGVVNAAGTDKASAAGTATSGTSSVDINQIYTPTDITFDALSTNLPLEPARLSESNKSINEAMLAKGRALQNNIEDLPEAIKVYEALLARISENDMAQEVMFNLIYCYNKLGETAKADAMRKRMNAEFKDGDFTKRMNTPALGRENGNPAATNAYKNIYNQFIEGNFGQALADKKKADSIYGNTYWTPQLLYIESVYYIKQKEDTAAMNRLNLLAATYPTSPLAAKAKTMAEVLGRRKQIEDYLTKANIVRVSEDSNTVIPDYTPTPVVPNANTVATPKINTDSINAANLLAANQAKELAQKNAAAAKLAAEQKARDSTRAANITRQDSIKNATALQLAAAKNAKDSIQAAIAAANTARQDSIKKATALQMAAAKNAKDSARIALAAANTARQDSIKNAAAAKLAAANAARDSVREVTAARNQAKRDSIANALATAKLAKDSVRDATAARNAAKRDSIANALETARLNKLAKDSLAKAQKPVIIPPKPVEGFVVNVNEPQSVMILLTRVDAVYLNEAANAFNRYHQQKLNQPLTTQKIKLNADYTVVLVNSPEFVTADNAVAYINKVRPKATSDIVPWLEANKFSFYIISAANLELLKQNVKVTEYLKALHTAMPKVF